MCILNVSPLLSCSKYKELKLLKHMEMIYHAVGIDVFIAELMVESNVTLQVNTILSVLNTTSDLQVKDGSGASHTVTLQHSELVAGIMLGHLRSRMSCADCDANLITLEKY